MQKIFTSFLLSFILVLPIYSDTWDSHSTRQIKPQFTKTASELHCKGRNEKEPFIRPSPEPETDYLSEMIQCCLNGDVPGGRKAETARNAKIDRFNLDELKIPFDDLYLLSKIITAEAGCSWLSMEWKMMVGEVLLNRVESAEFPNTIPECIYQEGQYYSRENLYFERLLPFEDCIEAAIRLLEGERVIQDKSVVFQAQFRQGSGTYIRLYDELMGPTYLCYSNHQDLYEQESM